MGLILPEFLLDLEDHGQSDGYHHHGRGGVGNPHRQKGSRDHEPEDHAGRAAPHGVDDGQSDPAVQIPLLHGEGDHEAPDEEHDDVVEVNGRRFPTAQNPQERKEHQGKEGRRKEGDTVADPPYGHEGCDGCHPTRGAITWIYGENQEDGKDQNTQPESNSLRGSAGSILDSHGPPGIFLRLGSVGILGPWAEEGQPVSGGQRYEKEASL
jgi:hypothetical protein